MRRARFANAPRSRNSINQSPANWHDGHTTPRRDEQGCHSGFRAMFARAQLGLVPPHWQVGFHRQFDGQTSHLRRFRASDAPSTTANHGAGPQARKCGSDKSFDAWPPRAVLRPCHANVETHNAARSANQQSNAIPHTLCAHCGWQTARRFCRSYPTNVWHWQCRPHP